MLLQKRAKKVMVSQNQYKRLLEKQFYSCQLWAVLKQKSKYNICQFSSFYRICDKFLLNANDQYAYPQIYLKN